MVIDSLASASGLSWRLDGPASRLAEQSFSERDKVLELEAGAYRLTVDGSQDATGAYALRLIDAASAVPLLPGEEISGRLEPGDKTAVYRFSALAGDRFYFDGIDADRADVDWRLIDPRGQVVRGPSDITWDIDTFSLPQSGAYLLLVEGNNTKPAPAEYRFNLHKATDSVVEIALDTVITSRIDQPGMRAIHTFHLDTPRALLFDALWRDTPDRYEEEGQEDIHATAEEMRWFLYGPQGQLADPLVFENGSSPGARQWLWLLPGDYRIEMDAPDNKIGEASFRLLSVDAAAGLAVEAEVAAELDHPLGIRLYRVDLVAGDTFYLESQAPGQGEAVWRLLDPFGDRLASGGIAADSITRFTVAHTGKHWLALKALGQKRPGSGDGPADAAGR